MAMPGSLPRFSTMPTFTTHCFGLHRLLPTVAMVLIVSQAVGQQKAVVEGRIRSFALYADSAQARYTTYKLASAGRAIATEMIANTRGTPAKLLSEGVYRQTLFWRTAFNRLFAQKLAYYSSGSEAVSLFGNYIILDPAKDNLTLGFNAVWRTRVEKQVKGVTSIALKANSLSGFTSLYQGGQWQDALSVRLRHTFGMNRGRIWYYPAQREALYRKVAQEKKLIDAEKAQRTALNDTLLAKAYPDPDDQPTKTAKQEAFRQALKEEMVERIIALEIKSAKYNVLFTDWYSLLADLPLTEKTRDVSKLPRSFYPLELGGQANALLETNNLTVFGNLSVSYLLNRTNLDVYDSFADLKDSRDTSDVKRLSKVAGLTKDGTAYAGAFTRYNAWRIKPQLVVSSRQLADRLAPTKALRNISLNVFGEFWRGSRPYDTANLGLGLLFSIFVKDDKAANLELSLTFRDFEGQFLPDVAQYRKNMLGFRVTLPFNSIIY
jgi:hypothetical protein